jgi:polysaccharide pyruvyl transferase CsaB
MKRMLVLGYYGFGNFGDELILSAVQDELASVDCEATFAVRQPTQYPSPACARHTLVDRQDTASMARALRTSDCVMLGGGGLVQDVTSWRSSVYYLGIPFLAGARRKSVVSYAQDIGPIGRRWTRQAVHAVFGRMALIDVRDNESRDLLIACGVHGRDIHVSCDVGLSYLVTSHASLASQGPREPVITACVNQRFGWSAEQSASFLDCLASHFAARIVLVTLFPGADLEFTREVQQRLLSSSEVIVSPSVEVLLRLCDAACMVVAGRYHMAAAGVASRSPMVALAYDPKVAHLADAVGFDVVARGDLPEVAARLVLGGNPRLVPEDTADRLVSLRIQRIQRLQMVLADLLQ